ncbi:DUF3319 domain-containing protein [Photobacterium sanctipauli]|uniref:DUF3319 domain-containing protein n=2 Tax=Photobacterium sanctipauli TaxID=1342794 RepID=UPI001304A1E1|nr:DUF3319 domain-containing protein [Photobacterium sanctipauli]
MSIIDNILIFLGLRSKKQINKKHEWDEEQQPKEQLPRYTKRTFYKGYYLENSSGDIDNWSVRINGKVMTGKLDLLQKSINWFCDTKKLLPPESFEVKEIEVSSSDRLDIEHHGYRIINDSSQSNGWYTVINGKLVKGTETLIKEKIDEYLAYKLSQEQKQNEPMA